MANNSENYHYNIKGFILLMVGQAISLFGSSIVQFSQIWWLNDTFSSSLILSLATFMGILPMILVSPFAGIMCDRLDKRKLLFFSDLLQALATFILIILFNKDSIELYHIYLLLAFRGLMQGIQMPVAVAIMSHLVPPDKLNKMNSLQSILMSITNLASPAIGAILITRYSIEQIYWLDVFTFLPASIILYTIKIPDEMKISRKIELHFKNDLKESIKQLKTSKLIGFIIFFSLINFFINPLLNLMPKLFLTNFNGNAFQYGYFEIAFNVGYIFLAVYLNKRKEKFPKIKEIIFGSYFLILFLIIMMLIPPGNFLIYYFLGAIFGICVGLIDIQTMSVLQILIPKKMQGRIFSTIFILIKAFLPIALLFWGSLADLINIKFVFYLSPLICLLGMLIVQVSRSINKMNIEFEKKKELVILNNKKNILDESRLCMKEEEIVPM